MSQSDLGMRITERALEVGISRRRFIASTAAAAVGGTVGLVAPRRMFAGSTAGAGASTPVVARATNAPRHLAWVWQFNHDGDPGEIRETLAHHGLGVVLKTHDGANWMSRYDKTPTAVSGPRRVEEYANYFEQAGVPFHAWAVVKGNNPLKEAKIASDVLNAGARSLFLDLEGHPGFWVGTNPDAERYGEALRMVQPNARLSTSIDPRPWEIDRIPLAEFASFTNEIAPQVYWTMFSNEANAKKYVSGGISVAPAQIGPRFIISSAMSRLQTFGLPIHPIGDGTVRSLQGWDEFIDESYASLADTVSVWRYGVAERELWGLLRDTPPRVATYVVQPGDSLGVIAGRFRTTVRALQDANGISNPNLISVGQVLVLPGGAPGGTTPIAQPARPSTPTQPSTGAPATRRHTVVSGDTLLGIALRYGRTLTQVANANGLRSPYLIRIGQVLIIP